MRGFTLVEALVAIAIITLAIAGPMYAANRAIVAAQLSSDQLTASSLAQEGIEYVRSVRDAAYLYRYGQGLPDASTVAWADFSTNGPSGFSLWQCEKTNGTTNACTLDPFRTMGTGNGEALNPCKLPLGSGNDCTPLYLTPSNIYTQTSSGNVLTPFTRAIQVYSISLNEESVISTVSWNFHNSTYSVSITDHLTPWQ